MTDGHDEAIRVALEHIAWAKRERIAPADIIECCGLLRQPGLGWDDALYAVARAWINCRPPALAEAA